jgi:DNA-binding transcriptional regulator YiaG
MTPAEARQKLGLSESEMAKLMGNTHPMTISKWETGERKPRAQAAELLKLLVWMHDRHTDVFAEWRDKI